MFSPAKFSLANPLIFALLCLLHQASAAQTPPAEALPAGQQGMAYEFKFEAENSLAPTTWRVTAGELPPGLALDSSGRLHGTPLATQATAFRFTVEVTEVAATPRRFAQAFDLLIEAAPLRIKSPTALRIRTPQQPTTLLASLTVPPGVTGSAPPPPPQATAPAASISKANVGSNDISCEVKTIAPLIVAVRKRGATGFTQAEMKDANGQRLAVFTPQVGTNIIHLSLPLRPGDQVQISQEINGQHIVSEPFLAQPVVIINQPQAGEPVTGQAAPETTVELFLEENKDPEKLKAGANQVTSITVGNDGKFRLEPVRDLQEGQSVRIGLTPTNAIIPRLSVAGLKGDDARENFEATGYMGLGVDSFAASDINRVINEEVATKVKTRLVGGFDFNYRLFGDPRRKNASQGWKDHQFWVYGQTVHGVRSIDVDCSNQNANGINEETCGQLFQGQFRPPTANEFIFILRNASSLEGFVGARWELPPINKGRGFSARPYLKAQAGFVTVAGSGGDIFDVHHVGAGLVTTKGIFQGSYLELGYGRTDLFRVNKYRRFKIDGYLSWELPWTKVLRPFAQINLDSDFGRGSDSIQSYFGLSFELQCLFKTCGLTPPN